jgi:hypothetical protein
MILGSWSDMYETVSLDWIDGKNEMGKAVEELYEEKGYT